MTFLFAFNDFAFESHKKSFFFSTDNLFTIPFRIYLITFKSIFSSLSLSLYSFLRFMFGPFGVSGYRIRACSGWSL
jgi:hypothetical protein